MLSRHNSLRDLDEEVAGIIRGHQAEAQPINAFAEEEERTKNGFRGSSLFEAEKANKDLTEKNGLI